MQGKDKTDEFLKKSLDNLGSEFQSDWNSFEQKLSKAVYLRRLRRAMWVGSFTIALIFVFAGVNIFQIFRDKSVYIPRDQAVSTSTFEDEVTPVEAIANHITYSSKSENNIPLESTSTQNSTTEISTQNSESDQIAFSSSSVENPDAENDQTEQNHTDNTPITTNTIASNTDSKTIEEEVNSEVEEEAVAAVEEANAFALNTKDISYKAPPIEAKKIKAKVADNHHSYPVAVNPNTKPRYSKFKVGDQLLNYDLNAPSLGIRIPAPAIDVNDGDSGPYVSPFQEKNPWSYSFNVYPNFTFRKFEEDPNKEKFLHVDFGDAVEAAESGGFSLNLGFEISRRIGPITYLNTGIEYISYNTDVLYNFTNFREAVFNNTNEYITSYRTRAKEDVQEIIFSDKNSYHYVNFPLSLSHQPWATDHIRFNIEAGASFLYFIGANGQTLDYQTLEVIDLAQRDFKNSIGSLSFKIGVSYFVSDKLNVGFEPTLMYFTNTIYNDDYPFYVIPYSVGMNLNLQVKLN